MSNLDITGLKMAPKSRLILIAIRELTQGGSRCTVAEVAKAVNDHVTNVNTILKALREQGLVSMAKRHATDAWAIKGVNV